MNEIAKLVSQYGVVTLTFGIIFIVITLALIVVAFVLFLKIMKDMNDEFDDWHKRKR